jgi:alkylation response protein AidB-like acyl-CoA dehydrogenase
MDVRLTDEQELWNDTVARLAGELAMTVPDDAAADRDLDARWSRVLELGVPALRSAELSGMTHTGVETALAAEQFGRRLVALPLLGEGIIAAELLAAAGAEEALERVVNGELRLAPAFDPTLARFAQVGEPAVAWDAAGATHALLLEPTVDGPTLAAVPIDGTGVLGLDITRRHAPIAATAAADDIGALGTSIELARWARVEALALTVLAADLVGIMDGALDDAVSHVKERRQFGVPVGSFQAVQHLAADAHVQVEGARSCVWYAAWAVDAADAREAKLAAHTAKAYASRAGRDVVESTIQMFGGVAITWEFLSHVRARRAWTDRRVLGDEVVHYAAIAAARLEAATAITRSEAGVG